HAKRRAGPDRRDLARVRDVRACGLVAAGERGPEVDHRRGRERVRVELQLAAAGGTVERRGKRIIGTVALPGAGIDVELILRDEAGDCMPAEDTPQKRACA